MVWSQSTVRGKLSLGKERKWDTRRWTHRETRRGKFGHIGRHGGEILGQKHKYVFRLTEVEILTIGFHKSGHTEITKVDKESICKNVWKQKITLSVTYLKANFYRQLRDRQEVEKGSELLWFGSTGDEGGSLRPWIRGRL